MVYQIADLKLRLLERAVQTRKDIRAVDSLSNQAIEPDKMIVCKAVEDRICKRVDLASRSDLTDQQVTDALRLLLKIVRRSALPVDFSRAEIFWLTRGVAQKWREGTAAQCERATIRFEAVGPTDRLSFTSP